MSTAFPAAALTLGQANALVKGLGGMDMVAKILSGVAKVTVEVLRHIVDGNADPFLPYKSWKVESHQKSGKLELTRDADNLLVNGQKIDFFLSEVQQNGKTIVGNNLRKELADKPVLNANVLDYLREHPELIPDSWKTDANGNIRYIFFWGTIYRIRIGHLCVRYLCWNSDRWDCGCNWLDNDFNDSLPAAVSQVSA